MQASIDFIAEHALVHGCSRSTCKIRMWMVEYIVLPIVLLPPGVLHEAQPALQADQYSKPLFTLENCIGDTLKKSRAPYALTPVLSRWLLPICRRVGELQPRSARFCALNGIRATLQGSCLLSKGYIGVQTLTR